MNPEIMLILAIMAGNNYSYGGDPRTNVHRITDGVSGRTYTVRWENYERANMINEMTRIPIDEVLEFKKKLYETKEETNDENKG